MDIKKRRPGSASKGSLLFLVDDSDRRTRIQGCHRERRVTRTPNRRELIDQAPARLLAVGHCAVWIEKLIRDLEIVAASDEPIGLEQGCELLTLPAEALSKNSLYVLPHVILLPVASPAMLPGVPVPSPSELVASRKA